MARKNAIFAPRGQVDHLLLYILENKLHNKVLIEEEIPQSDALSII